MTEQDAARLKKIREERVVPQTLMEAIEDFRYRCWRHGFQRRNGVDAIAAGR